MGTSWSGGPNECYDYWRGIRPGMYDESIRFWCQRWYDENWAKVRPDYEGHLGWGEPSVPWPDLPYIDQYESFNDVAGKYFGGRGTNGNWRCFGKTRKYYGLDRYTADQVEWKYCYGKDDSALDDDCGGFFENIGCGLQKVGGSFGDFLGSTLPQMITNGFNLLGAGADFGAWILANWPMILGIIAVMFVVGFVIWGYSSIRGR
jgi:hypothetical protein